MFLFIGSNEYEYQLIWNDGIITNTFDHQYLRPGFNSSSLHHVEIPNNFHWMPVIENKGAQNAEAHPIEFSKNDIDNLMETHFEENGIEEKQSNLLQGNTPVS